MKKLNGIKVAQDIATSRGGKCLSTKYTNCLVKLLWECNKKHRWYTSLSKIKHDNTWCPKCKGSRISKSKMNADGLVLANKIAKKRSGKCLSTEYINNSTKMEWECINKHKWFAVYANIQQGHWCPYCAGLRLENGIKLAKKIAKERNGKCLSSNYINCASKLTWMCQCGNIWKASLKDIKNKHSWCPECSYLKSAKKANHSTILKHWKTDKEIICVGSYEKAVVNYLNANQINFRWQSKKFKMPDGRTYRPDLYLFTTKKWIEVKGYFWEDAEEKWNWFHKKHPNSELWNEKKLKAMKIL